MISLWKNTGEVDYFVGNILKLFVQSVYTYNTQVIINSNVYLTSLSIGKTGYPFQIFVFPNTFVFNILPFVIHIAKVVQKNNNYKA